MTSDSSTSPRWRDQPGIFVVLGAVLLLVSLVDASGFVQQWAKVGYAAARMPTRFFFVFAGAVAAWRWSRTLRQRYPAAHRGFEPRATAWLGWAWVVLGTFLLWDGLSTQHNPQIGMGAVAILIGAGNRLLYKRQRQALQRVRAKG